MNPNGMFPNYVPRETVTFDSIEEADDWLQSYCNIVVKHFDYLRSPGTIRNRKSPLIEIEYETHNQSVGYVYGISVENQISLLKSGNQDKFMERWKRKNPGLDPIKILVSTSRWGGDFSSFVFRFGNYAEHASYYILYRRRYDATGEQADSDYGISDYSFNGNPSYDFSPNEYDTDRFQIPDYNIPDERFAPHGQQSRFAPNGNNGMGTNLYYDPNED